MLDRVKRTSKGTFQLRLTGEEREALRVIPEQMREVLSDEASPDDPVINRLFPPASLDDPEMAKEFDDLTRSDLVTQRLEGIEEMERSLWSKTVTEEELLAWMGAINDYRLVLGVRLDLSEDPDPTMFTDPGQRDDFTMYRFLSMLQEHMLRALSGRSNAKLAWELMKYQQREGATDTDTDADADSGGEPDPAPDP